MTPAETRAHRLVPMLNPDFGRAATVARRSGHEPAGPAGDPLRWLLDCMVDGLLHCACVHHAVHPDLIDCMAQRARPHGAAEESLS